MSKVYDLKPILECLRAGGLILYPTDTIWGIGCDATNSLAVDRVYSLKQRPSNKPFILLVSSIDMLREYVEVLHPRIETLLSFHVRPLTIIYDQGRNLPNNVLASDGSIGIRLSTDDFCKKLIDGFGKPLVATSANISNEPFPAHFGEISSAVIQGVDHVVRHRQREKDMNQPSVIARLSDAEKAELVFLRE